MAWLAALVVFLGSGAPAQGDDRDTAVQIVARGIRAHGGEESLARTKHMERRAKGLTYAFGKGVPFTTKLALDLPERFRDVIEVNAPEAKSQITRVVSGKEGWQSAFGMTAEIPKDELGELREEAYVIWLMTLVPLRDPAFQLAALPEDRVSNQSAVGVKVSHAGHGDVRLYFSKQNGRLLKVERRAREGGLAANKEYFVNDTNDFQGARLPTKQTEFLNGQKSTELTVTGYDFPTELDAKLFARP
jgi:hypothetical protein